MNFLETKKDDLIRIRINSNEKKKLIDKANDMHMTLSQYILFLIYKNK